MHDGRLELDDDGRVVDGGLPVDLAEPADADVLEDAADEGTLGRVGAAARAHPAAAGVVGALAIALVVVGLVQALRPPPPPPIDARVEPLGLEQQTNPRAPLVADYRLTTRAAVRGVGLVGPGVRTSTVVVADDGTLQVSAVADCDDPASLDERSPATYSVQLESDASSALVPLPDEVVDWGSALRRSCWLQRTASGLDVVDVRTRADREDRWLVVDLGLINRTGRPLQARSLDVADIAAIEDADVTTVPADGAARLDVRVPVTTCRAGRLGVQAAVPTRFSISVGPPASAPLAVVAIYLSPEQSSAVAAAAATRCGPRPDVTVRVVGAAPVPPSDVLTDTTAAGVDVTLAVGGRADEVVLGDAGTAFTADSRREFTSTTLAAPGDATLRWNARCASAAAPVLPLSVQSGGLTWIVRVVLDDDRLVAARAAACAQRDRA